MELIQLTKEHELSDPDPEMWRWSPLELAEFERMLTVAVQLARKPPNGLRQLFFAEAGSGIGTKLYLAKNYFDLKETGYEFSRDYLAKSAVLSVNAYYWDLREKHPPWRHFDIVYTARPFKDDAYEVTWEEEVCSLMKPGAVLISAYTARKPYDWPCYYRAPFRGVWMKPLSSPVYGAMITRQEPHDPLVPEPGPRALPGALRRRAGPSPADSWAGIDRLAGARR